MILLTSMIYDFCIISGDEERNEGGDEETSLKDGLADMMCRILNQQTGANPILAKRKTPLMKGIRV